MTKATKCRLFVAYRGDFVTTSFEFEMDGLEELERDLKAAIEKAPAQAEETLIDLAKEFKNSAKKKANTELQHVPRTAENAKYAIKKKWGHKLLEDYLGGTVVVWNSALHFHLVENGHNLVRGGRVIGFVPGKHIMERTRNEYTPIVYKRFEEMVDEILRDGGLD